MSGTKNGVEGGGVFAVEAVRLDDAAGALVILDQTALPGVKLYLSLSTQKEIWEAIYHLKVRGAPAIGIAAAYGAYLGVRGSGAADGLALLAEFLEVKKYLASARPTAVNLFWALDRMERRLRWELGLPDGADARSAGLGGAGHFSATSSGAAAGGAKRPDIPAVKAALRDEADAIRREDEEVCRAIGEHSLSLLGRGWGLLTHCNAGTIATARYGTALAPIYLGHERGYGFKVYADETRPLLQGARLTAWELMESGIEVTLICDHMASIVMKQGKVRAVLVGCDRVAANGDSANKIGTSGVAVLARHYGIPFYIHAPLSTIDLACPTGDRIVIEERPAEEVTEKWYAARMAPAGVKVYNPAFDVTDADLITAIITEKGIARPPYSESLSAFFR